MNTVEDWQAGLRDNPDYKPEDYPPETVAAVSVGGFITVGLRRAVNDSLFDWAHTVTPTGVTCSWDCEVTVLQVLVEPRHKTIPTTEESKS